MKNIFEFAEMCLHHADIEDTLALTHQALHLSDQGLLSFAPDRPVLPISRVSFPDRPVLLSLRQMPKRKLTTRQGVAAFFHAIAHVEFVAIHLAWDMLYRFRGFPQLFYQDWLRVADEEAQHFAMIREHLRSMHLDYGDLPAHAGLWEQATDTAADALARLALVPRCMEAHGLDVTPVIIEKFKAQEDAQSVAILSRILHDEVGHVKLGSYWFKFACNQQGLEPEGQYRKLIEHYYKGGKPKGPFNREMRIIAGFSNAELDWLET